MRAARPAPSARSVAGEPEREQLERDRRPDRVDDLVASGDHDEAVGRRGDDLLARVRAAAALDEPAVGLDLVGAVDRDVEPVELLERLDREPERARRDLGRDRGRDAADVEPARGERRQQVGDRRAGAEPDPVAVLAPAPPPPRPPRASRRRDQPSTVMRNAAVNGSPGGASRSPSCEISALAGAVIGSKQIRSCPAGANDLRVRVALDELDAERAPAAGDRERARVARAARSRRRASGPRARRGGSRAARPRRSGSGLVEHEVPSTGSSTSHSARGDAGQRRYGW